MCVVLFVVWIVLVGGLMIDGVIGFVMLCEWLCVLVV